MRRSLFLSLALLLAAATALAYDEVTHSFSAVAPRGTVRRVVIDIPTGEVRIRNGEGNRIALAGVAQRHFDGHRRRPQEQQIVDDVSAEVVVNGDEAIVRRRFGPNAQSWRAKLHSSVDMTLELPAGIDIEVNTRYGAVDIDGAFGSIDTDLRAGEVHVRTPRANVRDLTASVSIGEVHTYFGDHYIENEGVFPRVARFHNASGHSDLNLRSTVGEVHVTLTN